MAHGITQYDKGAVGFVEVYGGTWHQLPQYEQITGPVALEQVRQILQYEVVKVPLAFHCIDDKTQQIDPKLASIHGQPVVMPDLTDGGDKLLTGGKMFALVRTDFGQPVHSQSVSEEYQIFPNEAFLDNIRDQLLTEHPELSIESCGSLWGGRVAFVNILLSRFKVKNDISETVSRIMFWNAFGGRSISGCGHNTRVACNNTSMLAEAQGEMNKTLRKFKHTSGAPRRVTQHLVDITKMQEIVSGRKASLDHLAEMQMPTSDVEKFLGNLFPIPKDSSDRAVTRRTNNRMEVQNLFDSIPDLQGAIKHTRYAMFQATTAYSQHHTLSKDADETFTWWSAATGGNRHELNQTAYDLLVQPNIPDLPVPTTSELVEAVKVN